MVGGKNSVHTLPNLSGVGQGAVVEKSILEGQLAPNILEKECLDKNYAFFLEGTKGYWVWV